MMSIDMCVYDQPTTAVVDNKGKKLFDIHGEPLEVNDESEYTDIPERCPECDCVQTENWKDFTCNTVQVCPQCNHEMHVIY